ncbi:HIT-like protein [Coniochaeta ligniaria NRRL 30616]|uniref:HIT-like protein n=1 Tax=Coniochaeta ligniaria NRRL 30616 TaxID=1408157 RepID=A0A1J7JSE1_9PEZI|nr:HIT-like protein [Coniochaeta ligniaria NRRL 30616]
MAPAKDFESSLPPSPPSSTPTSQFDSSTHSEDSSCPFCHISNTFAPYDPSSPPSPTSPSLNPEATSPSPSTFLVLSTPILIAFLDILPLSHGHVLLCPRRHAPKLTSATPDESASLGIYLRLLSAALVRVTGVKDWNVVQNNGAAAAQVVPHMHFHIIPRPDLTGRRERFTSTMFGRGQREELDEDEGAVLAERIRGAVGEILREEEEDARKSKL